MEHDAAAEEDSAEEDIEEDGVGVEEVAVGLPASLGGVTNSAAESRIPCLAAVSRFTQCAVYVIYLPLPCFADQVSVVRWTLAPTLYARDA